MASRAAVETLASGRNSPIASARSSERRFARGAPKCLRRAVKLAISAMITKHQVLSIPARGSSLPAGPPEPARGLPRCRRELLMADAVGTTFEHIVNRASAAPLPRLPNDERDCLISCCSLPYAGIRKGVKQGRQACWPLSFRLSTTITSAPGNGVTSVRSGGAALPGVRAQPGRDFATLVTRSASRSS